MSQQELLDQYLDDGELLYSGWAEAVRDGVLLGQECSECGHVTGSPKAACPYCGDRGIEVVRLPSEGEVYSETTIKVPPEGYDGEYQIVIVEVGGARVLGRMPGGVGIGDTVELADYTEVKSEPAPVFEAK